MIQCLERHCRGFAQGHLPKVLQGTASRRRHPTGGVDHVCLFCKTTFRVRPPARPSSDDLPAAREAVPRPSDLPVPREEAMPIDREAVPRPSDLLIDREAVPRPGHAPDSRAPSSERAPTKTPPLGLALELSFPPAREKPRANDPSGLGDLFGDSLDLDSLPAPPASAKPEPPPPPARVSPTPDSALRAGKQEDRKTPPPLHRSSSAPEVAGAAGPPPPSAHWHTPADSPRGIPTCPSRETVVAAAGLRATRLWSRARHWQSSVGTGRFPPSANRRHREDGRSLG
jgi:hypothetical protein